MGASKKRYTCYFCEFVCKKRNLLVEHRKTHGPPVSCKYCDNKSPLLKYLNNHVTLHTETILYKCEICGHPAKTYNNLKKHQIKHKTDKRFTCKYCDYRSKYQQSINLHIKSVHPESSFLYRCPLCQSRTVESV